jgi:SAM-dependent methyltransferase
MQVSVRTWLSDVFREHHDHPFALGPEADLRHAAAMQWFAAQPGASILAAESRVLGEHLADRFGYHLLQVGTLPGVDLLRSSRILHRCIVDLEGAAPDAGYPHVRGRAGALPMESDSVDVMLLPHVLEFEPRPHEALREAARVLVPEGHLFVSALNPWSLLGVWRAARRGGGNAPWTGRFLAQGRMRDWLELVGLELQSVNAVFFRPPLRNARVLDRLAPLEALGSRLWPVFCGAYVLGARKRVARATPIRAPIRYRPRLVGVGLAGPSTRVRDER